MPSSLCTTAKALKARHADTSDGWFYKTTPDERR
jgi:hypothetical protein